MNNAPAQGILIMADISGYTRFTRMHFTSLLHAEEIISELMDAVITAAEFPLKIVQLEGDAVIMVAEAPSGKEQQTCRDIALQLKRVFTAFRTRERALINCEAGCACDACNQIGELKLKAVVHFGEYTSQQIGHLQELSGSGMKLLRTLIKAPVDGREYILMTGAFYDQSGGLPAHPPPTLQLKDPIFGVVYYLQLADHALELPPGSGPGLSLRLNQHSFSRMFYRKARMQYNNLQSGGMNLLLYLLEGLQSPINILIQKLRKKNKSEIVIRPTVLMILMVDPADQPGRQLLNAMIHATQPPLVLNKLEDGATLFYAIAAPQTPMEIAAQVTELQSAIELRRQTLGYQPHPYKIILHLGQAAFKKLHHFDEIAGEDVILVHRMMKNASDQAACVLMTESFYNAARESFQGQALLRHEIVESFGEMPLRVYPLSNQPTLSGETS